MGPLGIETLSLRPVDAAGRERAKAVEVADTFEALFVKTLVQSLRQTATVGGESMFGSGPGADTYAGWFDQNVAEQLTRSGGLGIAATLLQDMERHGEIDADRSRAVDATAAADRDFIHATVAMSKGGTDVVRR